MYVYWLTGSVFFFLGAVAAQRRTFGSEAYSKDETERCERETRRREKEKENRKEKNVWKRYNSLVRGLGHTMYAAVALLLFG